MFTSLFFIVYHVQNDFLFTDNSRVNEQNHENLDVASMKSFNLMIIRDTIKKVWKVATT